MIKALKDKINVTALVIFNVGIELLIASAYNLSTAFSIPNLASMPRTITKFANKK